MVPVKGQSLLALVIVFAMAGVMALILIVSASSQDNASMTVDGHEAVYSHNLPGQ
jgi:hypothetical protein